MNLKKLIEKSKGKVIFSEKGKMNYDDRLLVESESNTIIFDDFDKINSEKQMYILDSLTKNKTFIVIGDSSKIDTALLNKFISI